MTPFSTRIAEAKREASPAPPPPAPLAITGDQLAAALTQLAQKASATGLPSAAQQSPPGKMVTVVSMGQRFYRPGEEVNRWGIKFVVQGDGRTLEAEVDERLVKSGMEGGRYYPKGGDLGDAALIYWQTQYRETFGIPAPPNVNSTISLLQASIEAEIKRQEENAAKQSGEGKR